MPENIYKITGDVVIALAGNPNVGKSTLFNNLTGLNQHTGNWAGKTVTNAQGVHTRGGVDYIFTDLPGTYSLLAHSADEQAARDFICFGNADAVIVVCDATCLERNLNLALQTLEITSRVIVCVNLMDEARKKGIRVNLAALSQELGVPVIGTTARSKNSADALMQATEKLLASDARSALDIKYPSDIEHAIAMLEPALSYKQNSINPRWLALRLLEEDASIRQPLNDFLGFDITEDETVHASLSAALHYLSHAGISHEKLSDGITSNLIHTAEKICDKAVTYENEGYNERDRKIDRILTSKWSGFPIMLALLMLLLWLTVSGANYPSRLLSEGLFWVEDRLMDLFAYANAPEWLSGALVLGMYRVLAWVVSVMLPPMAIFFPLFTLLEDLGYLPRIAFNMDKYFRKCRACGKQALTMCMGFGCNAAGVTSCRIIDSPRERLIAIITNNFVPCNGRIPTLTAIICMFFIGVGAGLTQSLLSAALLTLIIAVGIGATFATSYILSRTALRGQPSSFTLELPPYRRPQFGRIILRSIFDRTLFVLGRAAAIAAPAGLIIWLLANITVDGGSLLSHCATFLDPFARIMGLDGVILLAFILGLPANEIVIPIIIMAYMSTGSIMELNSLDALRDLLTQNGWTWLTAINVMLFSLMHWPCSTTCLTIKKETGSWAWTALAIAVPTAAGIAVCTIIATTARLLLL